MKIVLLAAMLALPLGGEPETRPERAAAPPATDSGRRIPNFLGEREGCTPIVVQVAGEDRVYRGTRLDQQPPARMIYAVDREVEGCRAVTFVNEVDRRRQQQAR